MSMQNRLTVIIGFPDSIPSSAENSGRGTCRKSISEPFRAPIPSRSIAFFPSFLASSTIFCTRTPDERNKWSYTSVQVFLPTGTKIRTADQIHLLSPFTLYLLSPGNPNAPLPSSSPPNRPALIVLLIDLSAEKKIETGLHTGRHRTIHRSRSRFHNSIAPKKSQLFTYPSSAIPPSTKPWPSFSSAQERRRQESLRHVHAFSFYRTTYFSRATAAFPSLLQPPKVSICP